MRAPAPEARAGRGGCGEEATEAPREPRHRYRESSPPRTGSRSRGRGHSPRAPARAGTSPCRPGSRGRRRSDRVREACGRSPGGARGRTRPRNNTVPPRDTVGRQEPVDADHVVLGARRAVLVDEQEMVEMGVEPVAFEPGVMVDERAIAAEFVNEDPVAQPLRRADIRLVPCQPQGEFRFFRCHGPPAPLGALIRARFLRRNRLTYMHLKVACHYFRATFDCNYGSYTISRATRDASMTNFPSFSKFTVTRPPMLDCTCPTPQSGRSGLRTSIPGSRSPAGSVMEASSGLGVT